MIGVNDLISHSPKQILINYRKIVERIQRESPQTTLLLQSVLAVNNRVKRTNIDNSDIQILNKGIEAIASEKKLEVINLNPHLADKNGNLDAKYTADGIHLNGEAYLIWKKIIESRKTN